MNNVTQIISVQDGPIGGVYYADASGNLISQVPDGQLGNDINSGVRTYKGLPINISTSPDHWSQASQLYGGGPVTPLHGAPTPNAGYTTGPGTNASSSSSGNLSTLPPQFQALYDQLNQYLARLQQNGQVLNPNIQLDPTHIAQFLQQATSEIDPYYKGQLKLAQDSLSSTLGYNTNQLQNNETNAEKSYNNNLRTLGEQSADQGFAQSGIRQRQEGDLAYNTQDSLNQARNALSYNSGNAARSFAQSYGSDALPNFSISGAPTVTSGQSGFGRSASQLPLYQLSPEVYNGLTGTQQYQERADIANRSSQLEGSYRTSQGIDQARQLTI